MSRQLQAENCAICGREISGSEVPCINHGRILCQICDAGQRSFSGSPASASRPQRQATQGAPRYSALRVAAGLVASTGIVAILGSAIGTVILLIRGPTLPPGAVPLLLEFVATGFLYGFFAFAFGQAIMAFRDLVRNSYRR